VSPCVIDKRERLVGAEDGTVASTAGCFGTHWVKTPDGHEYIQREIKTLIQIENSKLKKEIEHAIVERSDALEKDVKIHIKKEIDKLEGNLKRMRNDQCDRNKQNSDWYELLTNAINRLYRETSDIRQGIRGSHADTHSLFV
jgi:hypothetical protein